MSQAAMRAAFLALALMSVSAGAVQAESDLTAPSGVTASTGDREFLLLPAHDLEVSAVPQELKVGDPVRVKIAGLEGAAPLKAAPAPGASSLTEQGWQIQAGQIPTELVLTPLKAGKLTLSSLALMDSSGKPSARTNPLTLDVQSSIRNDDPEPQKPVDPKPPVGLPFPIWAAILLGLLGIAVLIGVVYLVRRLIKQRRPKPAPSAPVAPPQPEDQVALLALAQLEREGLLEKGAFKKFYFRLSEILKTYLGARYRFDAVESTSSELIANLEERIRVSEELLDRLESAFSRLDRVKFTDHQPQMEDGKVLLQEARDLIELTRIRPAPQLTPQGGPSAVR